MSKTYIVDGNSLLFRSYYSTAYTGNIMTTKEGTPINAIFAFHNLIKKIKERLGPGDRLYVAFDTGKPTLRKKEFADYKAQRAPAPDELIAQMPLAREMLTAMSIAWGEKEGYEGDDLAGSMASYAVTKNDEVRLFTSDHDFLQLLTLGDDVSVEMLRRGLSETTVYTKANIREAFGLDADQIVDFKGMAGDPSDNYKGIKGIGEKTAMTLLRQYGHVENVIAEAKAHPESKTAQKIITGEKDALFSKALAGIDISLDMKEAYSDSLYAPYEKGKLSAFYLRYQLSQFLANIDKLSGITAAVAPVKVPEKPQLSAKAVQMSLDDFFVDSEKNQQQVTAKTQFQKRPLTQIHTIKEIPDVIEGITFDSTDDNENTATLTALLFGTQNGIYSESLADLNRDPDFLAFLAAGKDLAAYDVKSLSVLLVRNGFPKISTVTFDLLLATYLLNPDAGQKKEELFLSYGITLDASENIPAQVLSQTLDLRKPVMDDMTKNGETELFRSVEMPLADVLADMEIEGFPIDAPMLSLINDDYSSKMKGLEQTIYRQAGKEFNIASPKQLETILFTDLGIAKFAGEKGTGVDVLLAHQDDNPIIPSIIQYRLYSKLVSGYTSALPKHIGPDGKIHAIYNQALTATGRLSMSEPNLQNISIRNQEGKEIRKAFFYPNHAYQILSLDYSQIELRILAHIADIQGLKEIFQEGKDIHTATAAKVFNVDIAQVTPEMRRKAKAVNFGIVYGISAFGLAQRLGIPQAEAKTLIAQFKTAFEGISKYQDTVIADATAKGYVTTILGRRRYLRDIASQNRALRSFSQRAAVNATIQGSAADLLKVAMVKAAAVLKPYKTKIILTIHDELLFKVPKEELPIVQPLLERVMDQALPLSVPLKVDGGAADDWYEAH